MQSVAQFFFVHVLGFKLIVFSFVKNNFFFLLNLHSFDASHLLGRINLKIMLM